MFNVRCIKDNFPTAGKVSSVSGSRYNFSFSKDDFSKKSQSFIDQCHKHMDVRDDLSGNEHSFGADSGYKNSFCGNLSHNIGDYGTSQSYVSDSVLLNAIGQFDISTQTNLSSTTSPLQSAPISPSLSSIATSNSEVRICMAYAYNKGKIINVNIIIC